MELKNWRFYLFPKYTELLQKSVLIRTLFLCSFLSSCKFLKINSSNSNLKTDLGSQVEGKPSNSEKATEEADPLKKTKADSSATKEHLETKVEDSCDAAPIIDLSQYPKAGENLEANIVFYGDPSSTLIAIDFPKYSHGLLRSIFVVSQESKQVLAQRWIDPESDVKEDTRLYPIIFENIKIKPNTHITLLYQQNCPSCSGGSLFSTFTMNNSAVSYAHTFMGKPVYGVTSNSAHPLYSVGSAQPKLSLSPGGEHLSERGSYTNASPQTEWTVKGLEDCYITDLFGTILAPPKTEFHVTTTNPEFICYRSVNNSFFIRTLVRMN
ncbi:MAG: hypothetical protein KA436_00745 [Oligoflexales bacterium]|nr:hypothetical protein [Oligoflexales bacterium]